jgi:hypothetical protein
VELKRLIEKSPFHSLDLDAIVLHGGVGQRVIKPPLEILGIDNSPESDQGGQRSGA